MARNIIGVDVAKDWIDAFHASRGRAERVATSRLAAFARACGDALVVFEASGGYERPLVDALEAAGTAYARVNPRQAREFARARGILAKTDRVDARVLADMGDMMRLKPDAPRSRASRDLAHFPFGLNHPNEKKLRHFNKLARVLTEKVDELFRDTRWPISLPAATPWWPI